MAFLFILQYLPFFLEKVKGVDELAASLHKATTYTCDIISYVPAVNIVTIDMMLLCVLYYIVRIYVLYYIVCMCRYIT